MILAGDPCEGGARLALAACTDQHDLVARDVARLLLGQKAWQIGEIAVLAGGLVDPPQRPPDQGDLAAMGSGGPRYCFEARHIRGEAGDRHPRVVTANEVDQRPAQVGFRARGARPQCVRRVADHRQHALIAEPV